MKRRRIIVPPGKAYTVTTRPSGNSIIATITPVKNAAEAATKAGFTPADDVFEVIATLVADLARGGEPGK